MERLDPWAERLSELLDGELADDERAALEAHLVTCRECAAALDSLRTVVARARALEDRAPPADLWPAIAARIDARSGAAKVAGPLRPAGRVAWLRSFARPGLAAAGVALAFAAGALWHARQPGAVSGPAPVAYPAAGPAAGPGSTTRLVADPGGADYDAAVAELERVLVEGRDRLDPATVEVLERNLAIIDGAIEDARQAVAADPAKRYLNRHLADNMQRKLELLRRATMIVRAQS